MWCKTESGKEKESAFKKMDTGEEYKKKYVEGDSDGVFKYCLEKIPQSIHQEVRCKKVEGVHESRSSQA